MTIKNAARTAVAAAIAAALTMGSAGAAFASTAVAADSSQVATAASQTDSFMTEDEALHIALGATGLDLSGVSEYHVEVITDSQFRPDAYKVTLYYNGGDDIVECWINGFTGHVNMINW